MKNRSAYNIDPRLKHRVHQYLKTHNDPYVDISAMASELQQQFRIEYGRRNRTAFRIQVEKVHAAICSEPDISVLENKHLAKRARRSREDGGDGHVTEYSTDSEDEILEHEHTNHMNSSLTSLYQRGASHAAGGSTPQKSDGDGWIIDKAGNRGQENICIDLCEEESTSAANTHEDIFDELRGHLIYTHAPKSSSRKKPSEPSKEKKSKSRKQKSVKKSKHDEDAEISAAILTKKSKVKVHELQNSTVKFEDFGGSEETLEEVCKLLIHMRHPEVYQRLGVVPPRGFLLHGPPGCGKTLLAQAVAGEMDLPMLKVSAPELVSGVSGESEQKLRELFEQAISSAPCIMFIDEIDAITPKREIASKDMERRIVAQLLTCMDDINSLSEPAQVLVIGATNRPDSLDPALRRAGRFDREICLGIPDEGARLKILRTLCRKITLPEDFDYRQLARLTPGYVGADLMALCREAAMTAVNRILLKSSSEDATPPKGELEQLLALLKTNESLTEEQLSGLCVVMSDFKTSLAKVQPSAKREGFATVPDVTWEDVGALQDIREELNMAIMAPIHNPEHFKALGLNAPAGVLLAGPPGCGKTLLAKAVANESGLNFISVKGPELLNMYVGESERAVRQVFQRGRNSAPCVIFFDEIDALCPRRSEHESGASVRVVNQLLTEMDGMENRRQVFMMAATNRPDIIDPAVLRPGRLDKTLYVGLPPAADRHAILVTITKGGTKPHLDSDVNLEEIAHDARCESFTGADLSALVREASVNALRVHLNAGPAQTHTEPVKDISVSRVHFEEAFKKVRPSVSKKEQLMYEKLKDTLTR
ncbi:nuclear valosin-containing protein-like isoform X1 [Megalobrama amblycephala]|uniref:nuclear valosin-containing protein-like isoform X1 n=1 Tax=Megalobrama amblycephala TaxID=75352 RepID=UPI0020144123|nr:nuclear valosin-containing protein-like isoform X1 [Megalobrama amblycephala]